ncbi:hypothetical protein ACWDA8_47480, partial [Streptomyces sp. NPDC001130]
VLDALPPGQRGGGEPGEHIGDGAALGLAEQAAGAECVGAYREGAAVKALARRYGVAPKTIRRVLDAAGAPETCPPPPSRRTAPPPSNGPSPKQP